MTRLDFSLPDFTRTSWTSDKARSVWGPRMQAITNAWIELEWLSVANGLRSCAILNKRPGQLVADAGGWLRHGLVALPIEVHGVSPYGYSAAPRPVQPDGSVTLRVVVGSAESLAAFKSAYDGNDHATIGRLLGYPDCCHAFFQRVWVEERCVDTTWAMALGDGPAPPTRSVTIAGPPEGNILWRWMGVRAVPHLPCSPRCEDTSRLGRRLLHLGRASGFATEMEWMEEILSWPVEWSGLHGIAEIKTPVLKVTTQTDATAEKYVVRREGDRYPEEGARGLRFPYRTSAPRVVTSPGFRRGLENPIENVEPTSSWYASDNGFDSVEAMRQAHRPIVRLVRETLGTNAGRVLDLGCGNGALLRELQRGNPRLEVHGIDVEPQSIAHAHALLPEAADSFRCRDLFSGEPLDLDGHHFDLVLLMPGRLLEVEAQRALAFLGTLRGRHDHLLVYAYGDWLTRHGDLEGLVTACPGLRPVACAGARVGFAAIDLY